MSSPMLHYTPTIRARVQPNKSNLRVGRLDSFGNAEQTPKQVLNISHLTVWHRYHPCSCRAALPKM